MTTPDFLEDEHPHDGSRSVTSLGSQSGPLQRDAVKHSRGSSLATPGLGIHVMDDNDEDASDETPAP